MVHEDPPVGEAAQETPAAGPDRPAADPAGATATEPATQPKGRAERSVRAPAAQAGAVVRRARDLVATAVLTVAVLAALALALGAVLVGLSANVNNTLVTGTLDLARQLDGPFADVFTFDSATKQAVVNWGIAAAVYLIAGRVVERLIRPGS